MLTTFLVRKVRKAARGSQIFPHKYIRREGEPGRYLYIYEEGSPSSAVHSEFDTEKQREVVRDSSGKIVGYGKEIEGIHPPSPGPVLSSIHLSPRAGNSHINRQLVELYQNLTNLKAPPVGIQISDEGYPLKPLPEGDEEEVTGNYSLSSYYPPELLKTLTKAKTLDPAQKPWWRSPKFGPGLQHTAEARLHGFFLPFAEILHNWNATLFPQNSTRQLINKIKTGEWVDDDGNPKPVPKVVWERWRTAWYYSESADHNRGQWLRVPNVQVSTQGRARIKDKSGQWKNLDPKIEMQGYLTILLPEGEGLNADGTFTRTKAIGRKPMQKIMASTFLDGYSPTRQNKQVVDHVNDIRFDNRISNLTPLSYSANTLKAVRPDGVRVFKFPAPIEDEEHISSGPPNPLEVMFGRVRKHPIMDFWISKNGLLSYNGFTHQWQTYAWSLKQDENGQWKFDRKQAMHNLITVKYSKNYPARQFAHYMIRNETWGTLGAAGQYNPLQWDQTPAAKRLKIKAGKTAKGDVVWETHTIDPRLVWWYENVWSREGADYANPIKGESEERMLARKALKAKLQAQEAARKAGKVPGTDMQPEESFTYLPEHNASDYDDMEQNDARDIGYGDDKKPEDFGLEPGKWKTLRDWIEFMKARDLSLKEKEERLQTIRQMNAQSMNLKKYARQSSAPSPVSKALIFKARRGEEIDPHQYMRREGSPGHYRYVYAPRMRHVTQKERDDALLASPKKTDVQEDGRIKRVTITPLSKVTIEIEANKENKVHLTLVAPTGIKRTKTVSIDAISDPDEETNRIYSWLATNYFGGWTDENAALAAQQVMMAMNRVTSGFFYLLPNGPMPMCPITTSAARDFVKKYNLRGVYINRYIRVGDMETNNAIRIMEKVFDLLNDVVPVDGQGKLGVVIHGAIEHGITATYWPDLVQLVLGDGAESVWHEYGHYIDHTAYAHKHHTTVSAFNPTEPSSLVDCMESKQTNNSAWGDFVQHLHSLPSQSTQSWAAFMTNRDGRINERWINYATDETETFARFFHAYCYWKLGDKAKIMGPPPEFQDIGEFTLQEVAKEAPVFEQLLKLYDLKKGLGVGTHMVKKAVKPAVTKHKKIADMKPGEEGWMTITNPESPLHGYKVKVRATDDGTIEILSARNHEDGYVEVTTDTKKSIRAVWNAEKQRFSVYEDTSRQDAAMTQTLPLSQETDILTIPTPMYLPADQANQVKVFRSIVQESRMHVGALEAKMQELDPKVWVQQVVRTPGGLVYRSQRHNRYVQPNANPDDVEEFHQAEQALAMHRQNEQAATRHLKRLLCQLIPTSSR